MTKAQSPPKPRPVPITIVESPEQAVAAKRAEAESREHNARDLQTQIRAVEATEKQIVPSWVSALLSALGTILLVWTLLETRKSSAAAVSAAESARETLHSDHAWVLPHRFDYGPFNGAIDGRPVNNGFAFATDGTILVGVRRSSCASCGTFE